MESARNLQRELEQARDAIHQRGRFSAPAVRDNLLRVYEQAEKELVERRNQRGR